MTIQLKNDIRTIIEVLTFLIISFSLTEVYNNYPLIGGAFFIACIGATIYKSYFLRFRTDTILFSTLNDDSSKMAYITFGIIILFFAVVGYFAFDLNIYQAIIVATIGVAVSLFGCFKSPRGWLTIENNSLKICGVEDTIDVRQLKEVILANDRITLVNIYGEHKNSTLLKLNPAASATIKNFIDTKLNKSQIQVIDNVTDGD